MDAKRMGEVLFPCVVGFPRATEAVVLQMANSMSSPSKEARTGLNVLILGDPSLGKTIMLKNAARFTDAEYFNTGEVPASKKESLICIDRMDRYTEAEPYSDSLRCLLESSKSSKTASILAAANPKFGRFDADRTVFCQTGLPIRILAQFDLILTMFDAYDRKHSRARAANALDWATGQRKDNGREAAEACAHLARAAKINPVFSEPAREEILAFFENERVALRSGVPYSFSAIPILANISEAYARVRLSKTVEKEDAKAACALHKHCITVLLGKARLGKGTDAVRL